MNQKSHPEEDPIEEKAPPPHAKRHHTQKKFVFLFFTVFLILLASYGTYHFINPFFEKISHLEQQVKALESTPPQEIHQTPPVDPAQVVHLIQEEIKKHTQEAPQSHENPATKELILELLILCDLYEKNLHDEVLGPEIFARLQSMLLTLFKDDGEVTSLIQTLQSSQHSETPKNEESTFNFPRYIAWIFDYVELSFSGTHTAPQHDNLNKIRLHLFHALKKDHSHG